MTEQNGKFRQKTPRGRGLWVDGFRRLRKRKLAMVSLAVITAYLLLTGFIYAAELFDWEVGPTRWDEKVGSEYEPPSAKNILGTDFLGRSVLRKTLYGVKISITVAFLIGTICHSFFILVVCGTDEI